MVIYRVCKKEEVKRILDERSFDNVGNFCKNTEINSHNYKENTKYLHFFKSKTDLLYLNTSKGMYICIYDIPTEILTKYHGFGKYNSYFEIACSDDKTINLVSVEEYAIPSNIIKFKHLKIIAEIIEYADIEDFYDDCYFSKCINIIYNKTSSKQDNCKSEIFLCENTLEKTNSISNEINI